MGFALSSIKQPASELLGYHHFWKPQLSDGSSFGVGFNTSAYFYFFWGGGKKWGDQPTRRVSVPKLPPFELKGREAYRVASCLLYSLAEKYIVFFFL